MLYYSRYRIIDSKYIRYKIDDPQCCLLLTNIVNEIFIEMNDSGILVNTGIRSCLNRDGIEMITHFNNYQVWNIDTK